MITGPANRVERYEDSSMEATVARVEALALLMDSAFLIPGTNIRFGLDAIIRFGPRRGRFYFASHLELQHLGSAPIRGVSFHHGRTMGNSSLDMVVGSLPVAGDAFDVAFRANIKNLALLKSHLAKRGYVVKSVAGPVIQGQSIRV